MSVSTDQVRRWWSPPCRSSAMTTISFGANGARITVDRRTVSVWRAVERIMAFHNYGIRKVDTGAYNCRQITGGSGYSLHAYGIAVDVNWSTNPYGPSLVTDMPPAMIRDIEAIRPRSLLYRRRQVVRWGGRYSSSKDAMHFEIVVPPAALNAGVKAPRQEMFTVSQFTDLMTRFGNLRDVLLTRSSKRQVEQLRQGQINQGKLLAEIGAKVGATQKLVKLVAADVDTLVAEDDPPPA